MSRREKRFGLADMGITPHKKREIAQPDDKACRLTGC
jgi:hypothetical protein